MLKRSGHVRVSIASVLAILIGAFVASNALGEVTGIYRPPSSLSDVPLGSARPLGISAQRSLAAANKADQLIALSRYRNALVAIERYAHNGGDSRYAAMVAAGLGRAFASRADLPDARRSWRLVGFNSTVGAPRWPGMDKALAELTVSQRPLDILPKLAVALESRKQSQQYLSAVSASRIDGLPDRDFDQAVTAMRAGRAADARRSLETAVKLDPNFTVAWLCAGEIAFARGDRSAAIHDAILASTSFGGYSSPDIRDYADADNVRAARLLIATTD